MRRIVGVALAATLLLLTTTAGAVGSPPYSQPVTIGPDDFPDPFVLHVGSTWYAYGTDGDLGDVQVIKSPDLVTWTNVGTAIQKADEPSWAQHNDVWAPTVLHAGATYVLYNAYVNTSTGKRCIGAATSTNPESGFKGVNTPVLCNDGEGGVIDPDVFVGPDGTYLLWKSEGVPGQSPPKLWSQQLSGDGLALMGDAHVLLASQYPWEGTLVENPTMVSDNGRLYLFYSGNEWQSASYGVGWAVCSSVAGPCAAPPNKPLLLSEGTNVVGPGGGTVFQDENGQWWLGFAAWTDANTTRATGHRKLFFRKVKFVDGRPVLAGADNSYPAPPLAVRIAGTDRYDTGARFSSFTEQANRPLAYVATGADYPDALAAGPASGNEGSPVLLVTRDGIPSAVKSELCRIRPGHVVVMGGTKAISDAVYDDAASCAVNGSAHREPGANRYDTAARVSANTFRNGAPVAYIATGENFADALAGGAAGARNHGPLLLVQHDAIPTETADELARLKPARIVVIGGTGSVSDATLNGLRTYSGNVSRVAGNDRYETSAKLAQQEFGSLIGGLVVATGTAFPDAVAAGAAGYPILLVPSQGAAPASSKAALAALHPLGVIVMGGTNAVSDATLASLGL
jgi:putative cell wall-binding protein